MANHKSAKKRARQAIKRKARNHYYKKSMRTALKKFRAIEDVNEATKALPKMVGIIDRLAKKGMIHKNKANNLKGKLAKQIAKLVKK